MVTHRLLTLPLRAGYDIKKAVGFSPEKQNPKNPLIQKIPVQTICSVPSVPSL